MRPLVVVEGEDGALYCTDAGKMLLTPSEAEALEKLLLTPVSQRPAREEDLLLTPITPSGDAYEYRR